MTEHLDIPVKLTLRNEDGKITVLLLVEDEPFEVASISSLFVERNGGTSWPSFADWINGILSMVQEDLRRCLRVTVGDGNLCLKIYPCARLEPLETKP